MPKMSFPTIPIIQAPMAGGISTPSLVSAVANAGAVGSFGFAYSTIDKIAADMAEARAHTTGLINANFFVFEAMQVPDETDVRAAIAALLDLPLSPATPYAGPTSPFVPDLDAQLEPIWDCPPDYLTFHFGIPTDNIMARARSAGIAVGISVTSVAEAKAVVQAGADFVIAQGYEAGGHRGTFDASAVGDERLGTIALTQALDESVNLPIVSAGGIMKGADISAARRAGASAVQMGTAFLCAEEAGTTASYRAALMAKTDTPTCMTRHFSGRAARGIQNDFITKMQTRAFLPFPFQNTLTASLRSKAATADNHHYQSLWAGTGYQSVTSAPAADIIKDLVAGL